MGHHFNKSVPFSPQPSDSTYTHYDANIKLSRQDMTEIERLLEGEDSWRTGALDNAISQILVDLRQHDREVWRWHFEDTFGVELDTLLKVSSFSNLKSLFRIFKMLHTSATKKRHCSMTVYCSLRYFLQVKLNMHIEVFSSMRNYLWG